MGGGTSGLFFGTKGSKHEYQYSLFPDLIRKDVMVHSEGIASMGFRVGGTTTQAHGEKILLTTDTVLQKCFEYHIGSISAQELVDWLSFVVSSPYYRMKQSLRSIVRDAVKILSGCLRLKVNSILVFNQKLQEMENNLHQL